MFECINFRLGTNAKNRVTLKIKKTCKFGHTFYKSSDCPTCPTCQKLKKPASGFLSLLSNPARNTLLYNGIDTIQKLANHTVKEILKLHGMGKASLPALYQALADEGLEFPDKKETEGDPDRRATFKDFAGNVWSVGTQQVEEKS